MARRTETFTATDGRDKGKVFLITEMSAYAAERWAIRAVFAMGKAGVEIPETSGGMASIAGNILGAVLHMQFEDAEPLLNEMLGCVQVVPDAKNPTLTRALFENDIEEVPTLIKLRRHVFELHTLFLMTDSQ